MARPAGTPGRNTRASHVSASDAGAVLVIHTNKNGEISESDAKKSKEELDILRKAANEIDSWESPVKVIVSVLMLKEGWDVRNVTAIVGLRAYAAKSNILPEQTLGRGLRRIFPGSDSTEYLSIVGTDAFMDFVESIQNEGVTLERKPMGEGTGPKAPIIIEIDDENKKKDLDKLDIEIPTKGEKPSGAPKEAVAPLIKSIFIQLSQDVSW